MLKTAFIFPGQGSQAVGMGQDLVEANDHAAGIFDQADEILGFDLAEICFNGSAEQLEATNIQQPAILVTSAAYWAALTEGGQLQPDCETMAGLSLGEYTALYAAGALSFADALRLVHKRGQFMQDAAAASPSGMVSIIGLTAEEVEDLCATAAKGEILAPANFNCPSQIVISGSQSACQRAVQLVDTKGKGKAIALKVAGAFHCELMKPAAEKLKKELDLAEFTIPRVSVISNVSAKPHTSIKGIRDSLYRQVFSPVRWQSSIDGMIESGIERFIELGPGRVLTGLMRKIDREKTAINVSNAEAAQRFLAQEHQGSMT